MSHDVDSLDALETTLAWNSAKRWARRWITLLPFLALPIVIPCLELSRSIPVKDEPAAVVGPWMLRVKTDSPGVVGPWMLKIDRS